MAFRSILQFFSSNMRTGAGFTALGTGTYVIYTDYMRYQKMGHAFASGCVLPPLSENPYQTPYFKRQKEEAKIRKALAPGFSNEYYLIYGEVGTGKSRLVLEGVKDLISTHGKHGKGAPVLVLASQGKSFADSLASAVNFSFDEHISLTFFLSYLLGMHVMPGKDENHKFRRVLDAIEEAAYFYMKKHGRPAVIVIDDTNHLATHVPGSLEKLQEKAKLWADTNIAKIIFICNDDDTETILKANQSNWSRAENPIYIGDLTEEEALSFLQSTISLEESQKDNQGDNGISHKRNIDDQMALQIIALVGGRIQHLLQFKQDLTEGVHFDKVAGRIKGMEREKLLMVYKSNSVMKAIASLMAEPKRKMPMDRFMKLLSLEHFNFLVKHNILSIHRHGSSLVVRFDSKLMEQVIAEWQEFNS